MKLQICFNILQLAINVMTIDLILSNSIGFEQPLHLLSQVANSSHGSWVFFTKKFKIPFNSLQGFLPI
jgi:hypothetical protein